MSRAPSRTSRTAACAHVAEMGKALSRPALAGEIAQSTANTSRHLQALKRAQLVTAGRSQEDA